MMSLQRPVSPAEAYARSNEQVRLDLGEEPGNLLARQDAGPVPVRKPKARKPKKAGEAPPGGEGSKASTYVDLLKTMIPAPIVAGYVVIVPLVTDRWPSLVFILLGVLATVGYVLVSYLQSPLPRRQPEETRDERTARRRALFAMVAHLVIAPVGFLLWMWVLDPPALGIWIDRAAEAGTLPERVRWVMDPALRSAAVAFFTLVLAPLVFHFAGNRPKPTPANA